MPIMHRLDPEIRTALDHLPPFPDLGDIPAARRQLAKVFEQMQESLGPPDPAVHRSDHLAPGYAGEPDVIVRVFRPAGADYALPCLYWIQGGGYVLTAPDMDDRWCEQIVARQRCAVVSVDWRRAPEHPFPAPADDCYAGLSWIVRNAAELQIDPARIVIGGHSSGGGSTAGLALLVRDRGEFTIAHQLLIYPMLDDTNSTPMSHEVTDKEIWNRDRNEIGWRGYLADTYGTDDVSPYAAPSRMKDLRGVPPTTMLTAELDLFVDENIQYASRLIRAGVPTSLHVYPAACHGFDRMNPTSAVAQRFYADRDWALQRAFTG